MLRISAIPNFRRTRCTGRRGSTLPCRPRVQEGAGSLRHKGRRGGVGELKKRLGRGRGIVSTAREETGAADPSNGYEAAAQEFLRRREKSSIGVAIVQSWARSLPRGGAILDLGCGAGVPISEALANEGLVVYGIDASPTLAAAFRRRFPHAHLACEAIEHSRFFDRTFDGVIGVGLMFLLPAEVQRATIHKSVWR